MAISFKSSRSLKDERVSLREAVLQGQAPDGGLFVPLSLPLLSKDFLANLTLMSEGEIIETLSEAWLDGCIDASTARSIARDAINFHTPLIHLCEHNFILELFHGPTLAFKDYGARFLARLLSHFLSETSGKQTILVATSGDTGSAVASGFLGLKNIRVVVLYPRGRVSELQEKHMTTLGQNVTALEVDGTFDDCQSLVKQAFSDVELRSVCRLNSANSINIARLIAQNFYYFIAYSRLFDRDQRPVFVVPSGNLGNLTAGIYAQKMGLPVKKFVAATNANDVFPRFLAGEPYEPHISIATLSNAMDVGAPSNLERLLALYEGNPSQMKKDLAGLSVSDEATLTTIREVADEYGYVLDPHTAVGYAALLRFRTGTGDENRPGIVLSTAHPAKFQRDVEKAIGRHLPLPAALDSLRMQEKKAVAMKNSWEHFKKWLINL